MADVQLEHGHIRIANSLFEALLASKLSHAQLRVALAIVRATYGWRRKHGYVGSAYLAKLTGMDRRNVRRLVLELSDQNVVRFRGHGQGQTREFEFVKDFDQWEIGAKCEAQRVRVTAGSHNTNGRSRVGYSRPRDAGSHDPTLGLPQPASKDSSVKKERHKGSNGQGVALPRARVGARAPGLEGRPR